jgi:OOP family OmpA-OmpF porin
MFRKIAAAAALAAASSTAFAAGPAAFHAGVDATSTRFEGDDRDGGFGAFVGYRFNASIAVEGAYHRLANTEYRSAAVRADVTLDQLDLSLIDALPPSVGFDLYGRLGYNRLTAETDGACITGKEHDNNVLFGVGLDYTFTPVSRAWKCRSRPAIPLGSPPASSPASDRRAIHCDACLPVNRSKIAPKVTQAPALALSFTHQIPRRPTSQRPD